MRAGARVRAFVAASYAGAPDATPRGEWHVGRLVRLGVDTLTLRPARCATCAPEVIPRERVAHFDVSAGAGGHPFRGMALGLVAGAAMGAFVVAPCPHGNAGADGPPCGVGQTIAATVGGLGGMVVGGALGFRWSPGERWRPARWP